MLNSKFKIRTRLLAIFSLQPLAFSLFFAGCATAPKPGDTVPVLIPMDPVEYDSLLIPMPAVRHANGAVSTPEPILVK